MTGSMAVKGSHFISFCHIKVSRIMIRKRVKRKACAGGLAKTASQKKFVPKMISKDVSNTTRLSKKLREYMPQKENPKNNR